MSNKKDLAFLLFFVVPPRKQNGEETSQLGFFFEEMKGR
jgi:hypothetical protein